MELLLCGEELVACGAEALVDAVVLFSYGIADRAPLLLQILHGSAHLCPVAACAKLLVCNSFCLLAQLCLGLEVCDLLLFGGFKESLIFLIDSCGGCFKAVPYLFTHLLCHRTELLPLFVKLLQGAESLHAVFACGQLLCLAAQLLLRFQILLEIHIAKLIVDFYKVVEKFDIVII